MKSERGFVLLDVISGVLILCMGITFLMDLSQGARRSELAAHWKEQALNYAQAELEEVKAMGPDAAIASGRVLPGVSVSQVVATNITLKTSGKWLSSDLLELEIESKWSSGSVGSTVMLSTLLSRR